MFLVPLATIVFFLGCGDDSTRTGQPDEGAVDVEVKRGRELFVRNGCQTCHGPLGRGDGALAASLHPKPRDFTDRTAYKKGSGIEQIASTIATGLPPVMPGYGHLTARSRGRLARFIVSLQSEPTASPSVESESGIRAEAAWARVSRPPHQATAAYMMLHNDTGEDDLLLSVEAAVGGTTVAAGVELHLTTHEGEMMKMRKVGQLTLPAEDNIHLKPGGLHLMLTDLERPLLAGEQLELVLRFKHAGALSVTAGVRAP